jgi:REP element-mobilizing transposase RayT
LKSLSDIDSSEHHRRSLRLPAYDYSLPGRYFVTICTQGGVCLFGDVQNGKVQLNELGQSVAEEWTRSKQIRNEIELDEYVVMPNHFHGIVIITDDRRGDRPVALPQTTTKASPVAAAVGGRTPFTPTTEGYFQSARPQGPKPLSLSSFVAGFKSSVTKRINEIRKTPGLAVWQRNYFEHIIRTDEDLNKIREYILLNPCKWMDDKENPARADRATAGHPYGKTVGGNGESRK